MQRRSHPRHRASFPVHIRAAGKERLAMTYDIGTGGMRLLTSADVPVGAAIEVAFRPDPEVRSRLELRGVVVRRRQDPKADLWRFQLAIRFEPMTKPELIRLTAAFGGKPKPAAEVAPVEELPALPELEAEPTKVDRHLHDVLASTRCVPLPPPADVAPSASGDWVSMLAEPRGTRVERKRAGDSDDASGLRRVLPGGPRKRREPRLPRWLPPTRTLGGFYVLGKLGRGAAGSVFVVRRLEQLADEDAPRFALKVPDHDQSPGRTLSESEFRGLFRSEAGALLSLPDHENLAHLVSFDAGAKPKPILVMELVEGPTLDATLDQGVTSLADAFQILDGVAAGLEAMHAEGVAHLDVKPSNVIMRRAADGRAVPVLVDFGLSGRHVRPGCGTASYGAPEVWQTSRATAASPPAVDVYAFACLAYEVLTGRLLFAGESALGIIHDHLTHDGDPPEVGRLCNDPEVGPFGELLRLCLRADPSLRPSMQEVRAVLADLRDRFEGEAWPLRTSGRPALASGE